ncbi:hypothetical protein ID850_15795 [Xenorhabdus sp. Flor]|uniref:hypothetical protein n=1 Tax=Xenorhabdus cabanillasii TaxID=351673 RepID=UPI00199941FD|nr:hypothetical protein [Xenorhabdus sp. Flor]MBD2816175.1 hypothetical protein [Xenorhabdus sp. Flor]
MDIKFYNASQVRMYVTVTGGGNPDDPIKDWTSILPNATFTFTIFGDFIAQIQCTADAPGLSATLTLNDSSILNKYQKFSLHYQDGCSISATYFDYCFPISIIPVVG